ncbi:protein ecdysoneless homolog [Hetaerina americana]|uniref:protein ecdysoneless homolog n=1 Tax=Hetaerina americana TaxID=62018 RepID=UPI003A7F49A1
MASVTKDAREEDFIEYFLFPDDDLCKEKSEDEIKTNLESLLVQVSATVAKYAHGYIWHKDSFNVVPRYSFAQTSKYREYDDVGISEHLPPHLYGVSHYGDNIEDEWFIVFLLIQLSKEFKGLVIRTIDEDGEFLLIEAANHLPQWAEPNTCSGRVFLYDGALHLVGKDLGGREGSLQVPEGISCVRRNPRYTKASDPVQAAVNKMIKGYPEKVLQSLHHCHAYVPIGVAALLNENSSLIAPAVLAFCQRDPIDMKACRAMRYFPPENCVMRRIALTRCQYAMLMHQQFTPDRRTGWSLPPPMHPDRPKHVLGIKLACGFEILVAQAKSLPSPCVSEPTSPVDGAVLEPKWKMYLSSLDKNGYFEGLLQGSKEYNLKLKEAQQYFSLVIGDRNKSNVSNQHGQPPTGADILSLLKSLDIDEDIMKKEESSLSPPDDDSWLEVTVEELDSMLDERYGVPKSVTVGGDADASTVAARMQKFLNHVSGLEGAEFPRWNEDGTGEETANEPGVSVTENSTSANKVDFDADLFSCAVKDIVDLVIPEDNWDLESSNSESGMSSYEDEGVGLSRGKKNGGHKNKIQEYMEQMDKELMDTTLAESFIKAPPRKKKLAKSGVKEGNSSKEEVNGNPLKEADDDFEDVEDFHPVDVDVSALHGVLESIRIQGGRPGPATALLGPLGVRPNLKEIEREQQ